MILIMTVTVILILLISIIFQKGDVALLIGRNSKTPPLQGSAYASLERGCFSTPPSLQRALERAGPGARYPNIIYPNIIWWNYSGIMVELWWDYGGIMLELWWNCVGIMVEL